MTWSYIKLPNKTNVLSMLNQARVYALYDALNAKLNMEKGRKSNSISFSISSSILLLY